MSQNIRSKTYMQVALGKRNQRTQAIQMALAVLVLIALLATSQIARRMDSADTVVLEPAVTVEVQPTAVDVRY